MNDDVLAEDDGTEGVVQIVQAVPLRDTCILETSYKEREELVYTLLASLPRSRIATVQRRIAPLLHFDVVGSLPTELALHVFSHLSWQTVSICSLVSRRWRTLANDQTLWRALCAQRRWEWKQPQAMPIPSPFSRLLLSRSGERSDDEGMGSSDEEDTADTGQDSGFVSMVIGIALQDRGSSTRSRAPPPLKANLVPRVYASLPSSPTAFLKADYRLLYQTHLRLLNRFLSSSYRLSALQTRGSMGNVHSNTIYCLQLYTYPETGMQVLFTGSRDRTTREWNLNTGSVVRVIEGVHEGSVLSLCAHGGYLATAGSDRKIVIWGLADARLVKVIMDHEDSVLCVRFNDKRLVSCSKDRTVRTYTFPDLNQEFVLVAHRAAVNAVSISQDYIVSASGDRSIMLWDANTGKLLHTLENHHCRGIASIDFKFPYILSGSSDKHLRLFDLQTRQGWSTFSNNSDACHTCGTPLSARNSIVDGVPNLHGDLVRSVEIGEEFVLSGSYDMSIKIWDRKTGKLLANLTGGHTGRIFCIGSDCTKIVSCGEDQRICVWDFAHGIDTCFIRL